MHYLNATDPYAKTIIFCEDIDHAERMRVAIVNAAGQLAIDNPKYVMRITGDSVEGKAELDNFIDPESRFPVIATTSELLTTGVDAKTCKLIVLDKTITSMTSFKQIIGRGTRIDEENGKWFFTIMDFKKATELFRDPDFDGEPAVIYEPGNDDDPVPPDPEPDDDDDQDNGVEEEQGVYKIRVSGVDAKIITERIEYIGPDGELMTESYKDFSRKQIQSEYASLDDFLRRWNSDEEETGNSWTSWKNTVSCSITSLPKSGRTYGDFDLICHIAFGQPPLTRRERANKVKKRNYFAKYGEQARAVLDVLLEKYADEGISTLESARVLKLKPFDQIGTPVEIINQVFGGKVRYEAAIKELEQALFEPDQTA